MITEAVIAEGAKAIAKKVAKEAAKKVAKEAGEAIAKKAGKEIVEEGAEQAAKKVAKSRSIYTDDEKKELQRLRSKRNYYKNKMMNEDRNADKDKDIFRIPMVMVRGKMGEGLALDIKYTEIYFEPENETMYDTKDFREWMTENNDYELLDRVMASASGLLAPGALQDRIGEYYDKIKNINADISSIKSLASGRKMEAAIKALEIAEAIL